MPTHPGVPADGASPRERRGAAGAFLALGAILAAAAALRFGALDRLLPHRPEPDAHVLIQYRVFAGELDRVQAPPHFSFYPTFLARALVAVAGDAPLRSAPPGSSEEQHLAAASAPYVAMRALVASLGVAGVAATFLLARKVLGPAGGALAAFFVATSLLHVLFSQEARPHAPHMAFEALALWLALRQSERPSPGRILAASAAAFLGMINLQTGVALLAPLLVACAAGWREAPRTRWLALLAPLAAVALSRLFYVGAWQVSPTGVATAPGGHPISFAELNGKGLAVTLDLLWDYDPALLVLACAGLALGAWRLVRGRRERRVQILVLASYGAPYFAFAALYQETRDRFLVPLVPFLACLAASAVLALARVAGARSRASPSRGLQALAVLACLALPAVAAARWLHVARSPDTLEQAASWLARQDLPEGTRVLANPFAMLPLLRDEPSVHADAAHPTGKASPWIRYLERLPGTGSPLSGARPLAIRMVPPGRLVERLPPAEIHALIAELAPDLVVLEVSARMRALPGAKVLEDVVRWRGELLATFEGEDQAFAVSPPLDYQDAEDLLPRLMRASAFGPRIEVHRWPRP